MDVTDDGLLAAKKQEKNQYLSICVCFFYPSIGTFYLFFS